MMVTRRYYGRWGVVFALLLASSSLRAYAATCDPVLAYYRRQGLLREIDASGNPEAVFAHTREVMQSLGVLA